MATAPKTKMFSPRAKGPGEGPSGEQLRRDRITAIVVLAIIVVVMGLIIWLGSLANGAPENIHDYWPMMP